MHHFVASSDFRCVWCCTFLFDNRTIFARSISKQQPLAHNGLCYLSLDPWKYEVGSFEELCCANACCFPVVVFVRVMDNFPCLFKYVPPVEDHWRTVFLPLTVGQYHWILNSTAWLWLASVRTVVSALVGRNRHTKLSWLTVTTRFKFIFMT